MSQSSIHATFRVKSLVKPSSLEQFRKEDNNGQYLAEQLDGTSSCSVRLFGRLETCSPSFKITGKFKKNGVNSYSVYKNEVYTYTRCNETHVTREDVHHFVKELDLNTELSAPYRDTLYGAVPIPIEDFKKLDVFTKLSMATRCDYFRMDYEVPICIAFSKQKAVKLLSSDELEHVFNTLKSTPWKFWFQKHCVGKLKEMTMDGYNKFAKLHPKKLSPMLYTALRLYTYVKEQRENGHEVFEKGALLTSFLNSSRCYGDDRGPILEVAFDFLTYNAVELAFEGHYALRKDIYTNLAIVEALRLMTGDPVTRPNGETPCMPSKTLTTIQEATIKHVYRNRVTLLQGAPGTGKTEVLVGIMAAFKTPLIVTYVGMMVDALQKRFGQRPETANTIHYVCCISEFTDISKYDLLVIDEGSNVDSRLLYRILNCVSPVTRIVIVGDLGQIYPIKPGCPFSDLVEAYPQHVFELDENKRVDVDSLALARASAQIRSGHSRDILFETSALQLVQGRSKDVLYSMPLDDIMSMQIVTLRNVDRRMINEWVEEILLERGYLKKPKKCLMLGGHAYYPGKKVMFTKNTKPVAKLAYDGVRNGELAQILRTTHNTMTFTNGKRILIGGGEGVNPFNIEPGYATTANKSQGSEWKYILFWIYENPTTFFSREYAYVAVSRAKKKCIIVGSRADFDALCSRRAQRRSTLLKHYLKLHTVEEVDELVPYDDVELRDVDTLKLLPMTVAAVPPLVPDTETTSKRAKKSKI